MTNGYVQNVKNQHANHHHCHSVTLQQQETQAIDGLCPLAN
jgi:hypothetical protein